MIFYTYLYRDPETNIPRYAGKGHGNRAYKHLNKKTNKTLRSWILNLRERSLIPIIEIFPSIDEAHAFFIEECLIDILGRVDIGTGTLFNHTDGGEGTSGKVPWNKGKKLPPLSAVHRQIISDANKGKVLSEFTKEKMSIAAKGKSKSIEHRKKLSESNLGKTATLETRQKLSKAKLGKRQKPLTCPHCSKDGRGSAMIQWHFDNCRSK